MPHLTSLPETQRNTLLTRPVEVNRDSPFTRFGKPLEEARLAVVTTAGFHLRDDQPFTTDDPSFRQLPRSAGESELLQSHTSIGFDRRARMKDINVVFPIDRLRELVEWGKIGNLAPYFYSLLGAQKSPDRIRDETAPVLAEHLKDEQVDVVLITPT